jgi:hypothetical protein
MAAVIVTARGFCTAMGSPIQSIDNFVDPLTFAVVIGLIAAVVWALSVLGNLPGRIASERGNPHAGTISVLGWLGLLIIVLWPVALVWAYLTPRDQRRRALGNEEVDALARDLDEVAVQIATIKTTLAALASSKRTPRPPYAGTDTKPSK